MISKLALFAAIVIVLVVIFIYSVSFVPAVPLPSAPVSSVPTPVVTAISNYRAILDSDVYGFDIPDSGKLVNSEEECAASCNSRDDCAFFTYYPKDGNCWLKGPKSVTTTNTTGFKRGDGTYSVYPKTDVYGFDIQRYSGITQLQCEKNCESNSKCGFYNFNNGSCWLKAPNSKPGYNSYFRKTQ
ncbi:PAN/Apple domain-containing protein [Pacmanvirus A23]|uniref:PAN/Apple domain-containing protein n=1 Tax=Pacmanvirus A23 TaxID=1932881 RepID=UPI000A094529|nr:PAN/Apple domain-containing protein [Pacmanvirus A23]SIP85856.1 PAN/Apple domain-containing protein [Pacmanvirus A23]